MLLTFLEYGRPLMQHFRQYPLLLQFRNSHSSSQSQHLPTYVDSLDKTRTLLLFTGRKPNLAFTTKLIDACFKARKIDDARKLFEEMPEKNVISCSTVIYGYAHNGLFSEALRLFSHMQILGISPNSFTVVGALVSSAGLQVPKLGESIHGRIVKSGLESNHFVRTAMLDSYAKCGSVASSYDLFKEMGDPNLISCNAMIAGFVLNGLFEEAVMLFKQFWEFNFVPSSVTMLSVVRGCSGVGVFRLCESIHGYIVKVGFDLNISVINSVLDMYLSFGSLDIAIDFFRKMAVMDVISWTTMISFLVQIECATEALRMFRRMRDFGIDPDMVAMVNINTACALLGCLAKARMIHNQILVQGFGSNLPIANSLIAMYSKCGDLQSARLVFDHSLDKSLVSWTALISGYVQNGQPRQALELLIRMREDENYDLDSVTLVSSLTACGELANLELCNQFHAYSFNSGIFLWKSVQNSLISTYAKCGDISLAHRIFKEMDCPDIVSWNAIIYGYGINGEGEIALSLFRDMERRGEEPDSVTYLSLLNACSHSGLVDDGLMVFSQMVSDKRINLSGEHCGCVVDMLTRAGRWEDASEFANSLPEKVGPNVWRALLGGCFICNNVNLAEIAADKVFRTDARDTGHVVLLSNVYASVGRFKEVEALRSSSSVKNPGISLVDAMPFDYG